MHLRVLPSALLLLVSVFFCASVGYATQDTIKFGGSLGFAYSPAQIHVAVGDTVIWLGSFSFHPLAADQFPGGVTLFDTVKSGSSFSYVVHVAGTYNYECAAHGPNSAFKGTMAGSFTTEGATVEPANSQLGTRILDIMPNPATKMTMIDFELAKAGTVRISITSMDGKLLDTPLNASMEAGAQMIDYDCSKLAAGSYLVTLESNGVKVSKRVVVEK